MLASVRENVLLPGKRVAWHDLKIIIFLPKSYNSLVCPLPPQELSALDNPFINILLVYLAHYDGDLPGPHSSMEDR